MEIAFYHHAAATTSPILLFPLWFDGVRRNLLGNEANGSSTLVQSVPVSAGAPTCITYV